MDHISQLAIVGTGLLGTSIGLGLKAAGYRGPIIGVGRRKETLAGALEAGGVDHTTTDLGEAVGTSQMVIVAVPLGGFDAVMRQIGEHDHAALIITDVGSTKLSVLESAHRHLPAPERFVGSHPMAGSEHSGPEAGRGDLFHGKPCILTPEADTSADALETVESLWSMLGMTLIRMSPQAHDEQAAVISHLPHAAAVLLVQTAAELGGWEVASTGFRGTTRLASSNPPMRADILQANRPQVLRAMKAFRGHLDRMMGLLERDDHAGMLELLEAAKRTRDAWDAGRSGE